MAPDWGWGPKIRKQETTNPQHENNNNPDIPSAKGVARRGVWDEKQADNFVGCSDYWNRLTAGAVPMEDAP